MLWPFSEKAAFNKALRVQDDTNSNIPNGDSSTNAKSSAAATAEEMDVTNTPPDPEIPTGILSVVIHQINNRT